MTFGIVAPVDADAAAALSDGQFALFLDVDGTLLDLAARPSDVVTPGGLVASLARAEHALGGALALISGRAVEDIDRLFHPLRLRASGVHGAEMRFDPERSTSPWPGAVELPESLWRSIAATAQEFPGVLAENKGYSFAVHYRLAPLAEAPLREALLRAVGAEPAGEVEVMDARCAIEVKAPGFNKGRAIEAFLNTAPFLGRKPIFIGDDTTDEAGFAVVAARGGFAFSVGRRRPDVSGVFADPPEVRQWLAGFAMGSEAAREILFEAP